jgi:hypothetical protein
VVEGSGGMLRWQGCAGGESVLSLSLCSDFLLEIGTLQSQCQNCVFGAHSIHLGLKQRDEALGGGLGLVIDRGTLALVGCFPLLGIEGRHGRVERAGYKREPLERVTPRCKRAMQVWSGLRLLLRWLL